MLYSKMKGYQEYLGDDESPTLLYLLYLSFLYIVYYTCILDFESNHLLNQFVEQTQGKV